jgi:photosystem II stability/assembly factor-like uncharacterized protein
MPQRTNGRAAFLCCLPLAILAVPTGRQYAAPWSVGIESKASATGQCPAASLNDRPAPAPSPQGSPGNIEYIQIIDPEHWVIADSKSIWCRTNAGRSFEKCYSAQPEDAVVKYIRGMSFVGPKTGFAIDRDKLIATTDGGSSWNLLGPITHGNEPPILSECYFTNPLRGYVVGQTGSVAYEGIVLATQDGGKSWARQTLPQQTSTRWSVNSVFFLDENRGWISGTPFIFWTVDGGETWWGNMEPREGRAHGI